MIKNPPLPTEEEKIATAKAKKVELMQKSNEAMTPLLYAVELKMETDEEAALLIEWKKYQVLLNRIDTSKPDLINWPSAPLQGLC
ncbi:phage tail fiber assembly protein [Citrobacter koseri]|uniref:Phage tail fiber assembly protein n=1 Tax=Citrobacter koseri TaxID=545 RepID=A0A078LF68_CITKO|nr:phage tail fiber assembly protein [Citrobacter koseri]